MLNSERYIYFTDEDEENWFNALCYDENGEMTYYEYLLSLPEKVITVDDIFEEYSVINGVMRYDCLAGIMKAAGLQVETFYDNCDIIFEGYAFSDTSAKSTYPYVEFAYDYGIISGEEPPEGSGYKLKFFYPQRIATVEECIEFMLPLLTDVPEDMDYEYVLSSAKDIGLIYETDSFYYDGEKVLTYEIYEVLLKRMLNMKRYMYFTEVETDVNKFISSLKYRFYDETGEMTYLEYLTSLCPEKLSESRSIEDEVIKYYNIISVPYLNCLMAVTKIAGMRVEGLFDDEDRLVSIAEASCLKGNELEIVIDPKRYYADEVQYGKENILFARTYGIIKNSRDSNLYYYGNADVSVCVNYIMHILADVECMTDDEIYALAKEKGIVKTEDSFYDNPSERLDYDDFITLLTRMLYSQRYIYFTEEDENNWFNALCYDESGEMTYYSFNFPG
ncbi:MAG: hypothetical protein LIO44_00115 [Eubacterium sp.]|nr:hypothetical protein [Eubacterium sp.]